MKRNKTTWQDVHEKKVVEKEFTAYLFASEHGKSTIKITCPFCNNDIIAYIWSISGCGKRCDNCGAMLSGNSAYKKK